MNIQKMMKQAQQMQRKMEEAQAKIGELEAEGASGGGMVKVVLNGKGEAKKVTLDKSVVNADDIELLEDLVTAAINDAKKKVDEASSTLMGDVTSGIQLPPGMKLPF